MLTIDNINTYCHNSKLQLISITLLQKHIRSDIYEIDPFLCRSLVCVDKRYTV